MEIRVLRYFLTVARVGNITRAAEILHITQPTLSRQLMQLEDELGVTLFIRGKRKMMLTDTGLFLKRRAEEIVDLAEKTVLEICHQNQDVTGEIVIGCGITEATKTMGQYIKKFKLMYPDVVFRIRNGNSDFIIENINNGLIDIGFVVNPVNLEKMSFIQLNEPEVWGILMKKDSLLAYKDYVTPTDLIGLPLIAPGRKETLEEFKNWFGSDYHQLQFVASSELSTTASLFVQNDIGYAILIEGAVQESITSDLCFKPLYPQLSTSSLVIWKKYQPLTFTLSQFIDFLSKEIKEHKTSD